MIPKQIHQIWIQGEAHFKEQRAQEYAWALRMQKLFPDWSYRLWCEQEICELIHTSYPQLSALLNASPNYAFTSDLGRLVILHKFGGLYIDTDYVVLKPFDHFILPNTTFGCIYYDTFNDFDSELLDNWRHNTCLILSTPNSAVINEWLKNMTLVTPYKSGSKVQYVMNHSLMNYDRAVKKHIHDSDMLVLSNCLLEPLHGLNKGKTCSDVEDCQKRFPSAYAVHLGAASWFPYPKYVEFGSRVYSGLRDRWQIAFLVLLGTSILFLGATITLLVLLRRSRH